MTVVQEGFRFVNDDGDEGVSTFAAGQDTNVAMAPWAAGRIRFLIDAAGDAAAAQYQLEFRHKPPGGAFGDWKKIEGFYSKYQVAEVGSGKMPSSEVDMTVFIDLSVFDKTGGDLFDVCRADGGDIRVTTENGEQIPREVIHIDKVNKKGFLAIKPPALNVGTKIKVWYNGIDAEPPSNSTYGAENAWDDTYIAAYHKSNFSERKIYDATGNGRHMDIKSRYFSHVYDSVVDTGPPAHQCCTYDGDYYYFIDSSFIYKRSTISGSTLASNNDPCGDVDVNCNHTGAGEVYGDYLYVPVEKYNSCSDFGSQYIVRYSKSDLTFYDKHDISAQGHEVAALTIDPNEGDNGVIYIVSYCNSTTIYKYDLSDFSYIGSITISSALYEMQGICLDPSGDGFIISTSYDDSTDGNAFVKRVEKDGHYVGQVGEYTQLNFIYSNIESIFTFNDDLFLWDGGNYNLYRLKHIQKIEGIFSNCFYLGDDFEGISTGTHYGFGYAELEYTLPDIGSVCVCLCPRRYYSYNSIFDNSVNKDCWECWLNRESNFCARIDGTNLYYPLNNIHITDSQDYKYLTSFSWEKDGTNVAQSLVIDGVERSTKSIPWVAPGSYFYLNGGNADNTKGASYFFFAAIRNIDLSSDLDRLTSESNNQYALNSFWVVGEEASIEPSIFINASTHIAAGAADPTTARLTPPDGKTTASFQAGKISDDTNPLPSIDLAADKYTELEWAFKLDADGADGAEIELRVTAAGTALASYAVTPKITIGTAPTGSALAAMLQMDHFNGGAL